MKKLLLVLLATLPLFAQATEFKDGKQYYTLNQNPVTGKAEVTEFFSYFCPHCYEFFRENITSIKENLPKNTDFNMVHVDFVGGERGPLMSRAFIVAKLLQKEDSMTHALFNAIHRDRVQVQNLDDVKKIFVANGISAQDFDNNQKSFIAQNFLVKMRQQQDDIINSYNKYNKDNNLTPKYGFGVPAIYVNNKYLVNLDGLESIDQLSELINYLLTLK